MTLGTGSETREISVGSVFEFDGNRWHRMDLDSLPPQRNNHATAFDESAGKIALFGGTDGRRFSDLWFYDGLSWTNDDPAPTISNNAAMMYDRTRRNFLLFGGEMGDGAASRDTWTYTYGSGWREIFPITSPSARTGAKMVWNDARGEGVLFGGTSGHYSYDPLSDTWIWNGKDWRKAQTGVTHPDEVGPMFYDPNLRKIVMLSNSVTWLWDGNSWTMTDSTVPVPTDSATAVFDAKRNEGVLHTGYDNTTFLWNGKEWRFAYEDDSAENYILANMSYDEMSGLVYCYGGSRIGGSIGRAETWDGSTWTDLGLQPAGARSYASFAHDPDTSTSLLFGGFSYAYESSYPRFYDDTWQLKWEK
jgi:hypothetical protein